MRTNLTKTLQCVRQLSINSLYTCSRNSWKWDTSSVKAISITSVIRINPRLNTTRSLSSSDSKSILKALEEERKSNLNRTEQSGVDIDTDV